MFHLAMNATSKQMLTIYDLPNHILARICQYLLDDPKLNHYWCNGGIIHVLNFRSTCRYFNAAIKNSCLKFFMCLDFHDYEDNEFASIDNFLQWAETDVSWMCTSLKLVLPPIERQSNQFMANFLSKITSFEPIFSGKVNYFNIVADANFEGYLMAITTLSAIFSPNVVIKLRASAQGFEEDYDLPFAHCIKILKPVDYDPDVPLKTFHTLLKKIPNVEVVMLKQLGPSITRALTSCEKLRRLSCDCISLDFSPFDLRSFHGDVFDRLDHLKITSIDYLHVLNSDFSKVFSNLTSLSIDYGNRLLMFDNDWPDFNLPHSCVTVKLDVCLLGSIVNCPYIKNLSVSLQGRTDGMSILEKSISKFTFQLDIFVIECQQSGKVSCLDCFKRIGIDVLKSQKRLKALTIDLFCENRPGEMVYSFYRLTRQEVKELEQLVKRDRKVFTSHSSLQYFRMKDHFLVLKMSIDECLLRLIKFLDTEYDWRIAQFDIPPYYNKPVAFKQSHFTII